VPGALRTLGISAHAVLLIVSAAAGAGAQERPTRPERPDSLRRAADSSRARRDSLLQPVDTAAARSLGLPTQPSRSFPAADTLMNGLLKLEGYSATRYGGDSITLFGETREILLVGAALVERDGSILEAGEVRFQESDCRLEASGTPTPVLFDAGTVLVGDNMRYNTCVHRGTVPTALTSFDQSGVTWYLRGGLEADSASTRIYGASNEITSCEEPTPHYHITANSVKWVSNNIIVARPAVLYVRDVPVLWLPFIFQDVRPGRRSGMLVPRFGFNDLVRTSNDYRRHVSNIGYYFAINDYLDFQASLDWFSGNYVGINGAAQYRWLNRFLSGAISASWIFEEGIDDEPGGRSMRLQWNHLQSFDQRTRLTAAVDYATSARVVERNSVDPFLQTSTLTSRLNFSKQFSWGTLSLGGSHTQDLSSGTVTQSLPSLSLTPSPIQLWSSATWSPSLSFTNSRLLNQTPGVVIPLPPVNGQPVADTVLVDARTTTFNLRTPLRIGRWNWANDLSVSDFWTSRISSPIVLPDPDNPGDSVTRYYGEDFRTEIDWNTGINLPALFSSTWKLQPTIGIRNTTSGPFLLRNRNTNGAFVSQGKRLSLSASLTPTFFGFFPGVGPLSRIRHAFSPLLNWTYSPKATVPEEFARAIGRDVRESPALMQMSFAMSNSFEGKMREEEPADSAAAAAAAAANRQPRKVKLLSIQTSPIVYDFEQAKEEGRNGWATQRLTNSFTSDLLPGFSLSMSHDLWDGPVGYSKLACPEEGRTCGFDPFMTSISARFTLSSRTFQSIFGLVTGGPQPEGEPEDPEDEYYADPVMPRGSAMGPSTRLDRTFGDDFGGPRGGGFRASVTYDDQRSRPRDDALGQVLEQTANRTVGWSLSFSPSEKWAVSWNTQYNLTLDQFGQHALRLERTLHRWRATFAFLKAPNGNFAFNFFISLRDQPEMKFQYDQRTVRQ
jgi:hypothetical protein